LGYALLTQPTLAGGLVVYGLLKKAVGIRMGKQEEFNWANLNIYKIVSTSDD